MEDSVDNRIEALGDGFLGLGRSKIGTFSVTLYIHNKTVTGQGKSIREALDLALHKAEKNDRRILPVLWR
jgi:hypothetical protein